MIILHSQGTHTHPFGVYSGSLAVFVADVCVDIVDPTLMDFAYMFEQTVPPVHYNFMQLLVHMVLKLMLSACNSFLYCILNILIGYFFSYS